jgi:hypothetical protein
VIPSSAIWTRCVLATVIAMLASVAALRPASADDIVLTLSRGPENVELIEFTLEELAALPQATILTENEWTDGLVSYRGPLVRDVLEHLALQDAEMLRFTAANDYYVDIPGSDFRRYNAIIAIEADGKRLSRREKGPLWVMYPISDHDELRTQVYYSRLIWQVVRIESL